MKQKLMILIMLCLVLFGSCGVQEQEQTSADIKRLHVMAYNTELELMAGESSKQMYFTVAAEGTVSLDDIEFVVENEQTATVNLDSIFAGNCVYYYIEGLSAGQTQIYFTADNGNVVSEKIYVTVMDGKREDEYVNAFKPVESTAKTPEKSVVTDRAEEYVASASVNESKAYNSSVSESNTYEAGAYESTSDAVTQESVFVLNTNSKKFHYPNCSSVKTIKATNYGEFSGTRDEAIAQGYSPCGRCKP